MNPHWRELVSVFCIAVAVLVCHLVQYHNFSILAGVLLVITLGTAPSFLWRR